MKINTLEMVNGVAVVKVREMAIYEMPAAGLTDEDFLPKPKNNEQDDTAERLEILEQAFAEFVAEVLEDG